MAEEMSPVDKIRHSCAHVMADAVQCLFPEAKLAIGPVIENGFYYDFDYEPGFTPDDLVKIKEKMKAIIRANHPFVRREVSKQEAIDFFTRRKEPYKLELIGELGDQTITFYQDGDFTDLCRGPHAEKTGDIKAFELLKIAGAYWRGCEKNKMLQRIYGTAFASKEELKGYLTFLEEAEKRDHRRLGKTLDLFHIQEEAVGQVFWHPKGWTLWRTLENYIRRKLESAGYSEVKTPQLIDRKLWEASGHWENYRPNMFIAEVDEGGGRERRVLAVKPMNCPGHVQIFNQGLKSYRDLPLRIAEFGSCHRYEPSGALHGIMRVRSFVQDDAHIFCTEEQIIPETQDFVRLLSAIYRELGFTSFVTKLATRPQQRGGTEAQWDLAEEALANACKAMDLPYVLNEGEGTFYAPKLEFVLRDAIGRDWQCGTIQLDYVLPERLGAEYVAEDGSRKRPVMLHRAILGSIERFIGILIEHHAGAFPLWLAPVQMKILTIGADHVEYALQLCKLMKEAGFRVEMDARNEKLGLKVREATLSKVPYQLVIGAKEVSENKLAIRSRDEGDLGSMDVNEFIEKLKRNLKEIA